MQNPLYRNYGAAYEHLKKNLTAREADGSFYRRQSDFPLLPDDSLTEEEKKLDSYMSELRDAYRLDIQRPYPASSPFYAVKDLINDSVLMKIFKKMPKGGLLHVHSAAALSADEFMDLLTYWCSRYVSTPKVNDAPDNALYVVWNPRQEDRFVKGTLLFKWFIEEDLQMQALINICAPLSVILGNEESRRELSSLLFFTQDVENIPYRWDALNAMFSRTSNVLEDAEFYKEYHVRFFKECIKDNISYVEMRSGFASFHTSGMGDGFFRSVLSQPDYHWSKHFYFQEMNAPDGVQSSQFLDLLLEAQNEVKKLDSTFLVRVILNARRDLNPNDPVAYGKIMDKINTAILFHQGENEDLKPYNDFVIGFDFVSEEDRGFPTESYKGFIYGSAMIGQTEKDPEWQKRFIDNNINGWQPRLRLIDFYLHDGESTWGGNNNVLDACIISRYRVGHGFNLIQHPAIANELAFIDAEHTYTYTNQARFPMLEICPISNQLLQYYSDLRTHPASMLMKQGIQCVICSDDPQMFGNGGLSYDFWMAYMGFGIDLAAVKRLVYNAYYAKSRYQAEGRDTEFDRQWQLFITEASQLVP